MLYYSSTVLNDIEKFQDKVPHNGYPLAEYAQAKGFDKDLFYSFIGIVYKANPGLFELTADQVVEFKDILSYYETIQNDDHHNWLKHTTPERFDDYWARVGYNYPYLLNVYNRDLPENYKREWYIASTGNTPNIAYQPNTHIRPDAIQLTNEPIRDNFNRLFPLIPTASEKPFETYIPLKTLNHCCNGCFMRH